MVGKAQRHSFRPMAEGLEDRNLMSGLTYEVTNAANAGPGSLRRAILLSNDHDTDPSSPNIIKFDIPGSGVHTILLSQSLQAITAPVLVDGYTQAGSSVNTKPLTSPASNNAVLTVQLNGRTGVDGYLFVGRGGAGSTIRGLSIVNEGKPTSVGVVLKNTTHVSVTGNSFSSPNPRTERLGAAIGIEDGGKNTIGGSTAFPALQNVMGQYNIGVNLAYGTKNNGIIGNIVGQPNPVPSTSIGVYIVEGSHDNDVESNLIFFTSVPIRNLGMDNVIKNNTVSGK